MENIDFERNNQRKIEKFVLIFFSIYSVCMILMSMMREWESWLPFLFFLAAALDWILYFREWRDYRARVIVTMIVMQLSLLLYGVREESLFPVLAIVAFFAVLAGIYGITDLFYDTIITTAILIFYHAVILQTIRFDSFEDVIVAFLQIGNIFAEQLVLCFWVKQRNMSIARVSESIDALQMAQRSKDDFLANVSHEIRTPINTICGMSEIVQQEDDPQKIKEQVRHIQNAGRNLMSLVSDILDFSELQAGKVELEEEAYNITSMLNDLIQMAIAKKNEKPLELIVNCDPDLPSSLYGDEKKIRRVVSNILENAIKFTNEGCVSIGISGRKEAYGINLCITIGDTGIGMTEESLEKLFTSFARVDTKRNRQEGGMGLGLAISQAIVRKMGGIITVKSKYGRGTSVKVVIPQKVLNEQPIADIADRDKLDVAVYVNMEQFEMMAIRDEYTDSICRMANQLKVRCRLCRNLAELKRREEREDFTHVFISAVEYKEDRAYFDALALKCRVIIVIDPWQEKDVPNPNIMRIYKPFYILPIVSVLNGEEEKDGQRHRHVGRFTAPTAHILVVDDNEMNISVITELLKKYQIRVTAAESGREALEKIETMDYDFVFMDHMMPEMDGVETLHRIREKVGSYYQKVPVIMLTANAIAGMRERFLKEGFADFLEKPVEVSVLERVLRRNLPAEKILAPEEADKTKTQEKEKAQEQEINGIDIQTGLMYCGGEEGYRKILGNYCARGESHLEELTSLYQEEAWEAYTIAVHGIKSAMMSIGAVQLSELARGQEAAGKAGDLDYIRSHHGELVDEYRKILKGIRESRWGDTEQMESCTEEKKPDTKVQENLQELDTEELREIIKQLEDAMYELDQDEMLSILDGLDGYSYCGKAFRNLLIPVRRKIKMSDYMSAVDVLKQACMRIEASREGGGTC